MYVQLSLLITLTIQAILTYSSAEDVALPEIWPAIRSDKSYHLLFQLWMQNSRDKLILEEWASFEKNLFRLDMITNKQRTTYITNGNTGEVFRYKPFVCNQLVGNSSDLAIISYLFKGFGLGSAGGKQVAAYGLGPLWLRAKLDAQGVRLMEKNPKSKGLLKSFVGYEITGWSTDSSPEEAKNNYRLRLYFSPGEGKFVDGIEWLEPNPIPSMKRGQNNIVARAKLILTDVRTIDESIFDLPIGYGCQRDASFEKNEDVSNYADDLFRPGTPSEVLLEVTTSKPLNNEINKWLSQRHLVQVVQGTLERSEVQQNYYAVTVQFRDRTSGELIKQKRVWSAREGVSLSTVYSLDSSATVKETCTSQQMNLRNLIGLEFPNYGQVVELSTLNLELIEWLFKDIKDYHLIRKQVLPNDDKMIEEQVEFYEKRLPKLEQEGSPAGPVSIVKKIKSTFFLISREDQTSSVKVDLGTQTTIMLFFYSESFDVIISKAVIELVERKELDITLMHQQTDVSACFGAQEQQELTIKYPMKTRELSNALEKFKQPLTEQFLIHLFATTTVELLQVTRAKLTFDDFFMYFNLKLLDLPLTHTFEMTRKSQLVNSKPGDVIEITASNPEKCASACEHYDCRRFSYNWSGKVCRVELNHEAAVIQEAFLSELYSYHQPKSFASQAWERAMQSVGITKSILNPAAVLNVFTELLTYRRSNDDELIPLRVHVPKMMLPSEDADTLTSIGDVIELKPISVHSEIDYMDELSVNDTELQALGRHSNMRVEYTILFYWSKLSDGVVFERIMDVPYEECAEACEATDCRSFSYDSFNQLCLLSQLQSKQEIEASTIKQGSSVVYIIDYLSKFERLGMRSKPVSSRKVLDQVKTAQDCASACMEELGFACQGFDLCPTTGCLLTNNHVNDVQGSQNRVQIVNKHGESCVQFSRSLLSQFDKYYGKMLKLSQDQQVELQDLGAEKCAQGCLHHSCLAFHVCRERDSEGVSKQHCLLAKREIKKSNVEKSKNCNIFVLSDRSQFNQHKKINWADGKLESDKPSLLDDQSSLNDHSNDVILDKDKQELLDQDVNKALLEMKPLEILAHSSYAAGIIYIVFGLILGFLGTFVWQKREGVISSL